ncbi:MAG TPA: hypothetical protein V6D29_06245 [Leptolyngbyaceae cyanobacterium]
MSTQVALSPNRLEQLVSEICMNRKITRHDQTLLMTLAAQPSLSEHQTTQINFLYERLQSGLIRVVD